VVYRMACQYWCTMSSRWYSITRKRIDKCDKAETLF
jgi:hypothetical protein